MINSLSTSDSPELHLIHIYLQTSKLARLMNAIKFNRKKNKSDIAETVSVQKDWQYLN